MKLSNYIQLCCSFRPPSVFARLNQVGTLIYYAWCLQRICKENSVFIIFLSKPALIHFAILQSARGYRCSARIFYVIGYFEVLLGNDKYLVRCWKVVLHLPL